MNAPVVIVVNPRSQGGRTARRLAALETVAQRILGPVEVRSTTCLGDGARLAREAALAGAELVVACGGDGTASEVAAGLIAAGGSCAMGLLPAGTGSDLARTLGMPKGWSEALVAIRDAVPRRADAIKGTFVDADGAAVIRHGINVVGMGLAGDVVRRVNRSDKPFGGTVAFLSATVAGLLAWKAPHVEVRWWEPSGAVRTWTGPLANVFVANGRYCGSGMCVGPAGRMDDGVLEVVVVPQLPLPSMLVEFPRLYDGSLPDSPKLVSGQATRVEVQVRTGGPVPCDLDGEAPGFLPASIEVVPAALWVKAPWAPPRRT